jgi:hypothetical protein
MGFVYDKVASFLASDFKKVNVLVGEQRVQEAAATQGPSSSQRVEPLAPTTYLYDVFFSYDTSMADWVLEFTERLNSELAAMRSEPVKTFMDVQEIRVGDAWADTLADALLRSKVLVAFITPRYIKSRFAWGEFLAFRKRAGLTGKSLVLPVLLRGDDFPSSLREIRWLDLREHSLQKSNTKRSIELQHKIIELAAQLDRLIDAAPPFNSAWRELSESVYRDDASEASPPPDLP